ncbi:MAG: ATP-binding protein [Candidatus Gracilibacteria bacterium]|jgi:hypothetical protein
MYISRYIEETVKKTSKTFKVLYLGGPRQAGKTTVLKHLAKGSGMTYVTLDDREMRRLAQKDPAMFLESFTLPILIDEAQYAPELFPYIKMKVDNSTKRGRFWLTGSQTFSMIKNLQESMAGRVGILKLLPLSFAEKNGITKRKQAFFISNEKEALKQRPPVLNKDIKDIFEDIIEGSYPELAGKNSPSAELYYSGYLQTYIERDLSAFFGVRKQSDFHSFLQLCAARTGQILNISELAKDAGISVNAAKEWITILETSGIIYQLKPYHRNFSKRLIKAPKLYFLDTGLAAHLTKWKTAESLRFGNMAGAFFETWVVSEIIKSYTNRGEEPPAYYYRDKEGHEIDLLLEKDGVLSPIEIKMKIAIGEDDLKHIRYLKKKHPSLIKTGVVITATDKMYFWDSETVIYPATGIN